MDNDRSGQQNLGDLNYADVGQNRRRGLMLFGFGKVDRVERSDFVITLRWVTFGELSATLR